MVNSLDRYDACVASRFISARGMKDAPLHRILIGKFANSFSCCLIRSPVRNNTGGFRACPADIVRAMAIQEIGFAVQLEIMTKLLRKKAHFTEIPFLLVNREIGTSKLRYIKTIPKYLKRVLHLLAIQWL